jgi:hypothetical protein
MVFLSPSRQLSGQHLYPTTINTSFKMLPDSLFTTNYTAVPHLIPHNVHPVNNNKVIKQFSQTTWILGRQGGNQASALPLTLEILRRGIKNKI